MITYADSENTCSCVVEEGVVFEWAAGDKIRREGEDNVVRSQYCKAGLQSRGL
jgi:hypothetical protein